MDAFGGNSIKDLVKRLLSNSRGCNGALMVLVGACLLYSIHHLQNDVLFHERLSSWFLWVGFKATVDEFSGLGRAKPKARDSKPLVPWNPPAKGSLAINVDNYVCNELSIMAMMVCNFK